MDEDHSVIDRKLLHEIFNTTSRDNLVEALLLKQDNLIDCTDEKYFSPNRAIDLMIRTKMVKEREDVKNASATDLHIKAIKIPDDEVAKYEEKLAAIEKSKEASNQSSAIEEVLKHAGIEKANECRRFLVDNFYLSNVEQLKNLGDYEIEQTALFLSIPNQEAKKYFEKIRKL